MPAAALRTFQIPPVNDPFIRQTPMAVPRVSEAQSRPVTSENPVEGKGGKKPRSAARVETDAFAGVKKIPDQRADSSLTQL
jgi:hypothetical protein